MGVFTVGRQVALEIDMPGWWLANASVDMDFRRGLYYDSSTANPRTAANFLTCTRASVGYAKTSAGTLSQFASNTLRITDLGLLVEDARTNLVRNSSNWTVSPWAGAYEATMTGGFSAPDGTSTAYSLIESTANDAHQSARTDESITSGTARPFTISCFIKWASGNRIMEFYHYDQSSNGYRFYIDSSGNVTTLLNGSGSGVAYTITALANGWYYFTGTSTCLTTATSQRIHIAFVNTGTNEVYTGDGTSGFYVWGPQIEEASFASSYIPTTGTSAARAAENITTSGSLQTAINAATGSIVAQTDNGLVSSVAANIVDSNGTNLLGFDASNHGLASMIGTLATANTANRTTQDKLGLAWNASGRSLVLNGGTVATDASAQTPSATQHIGSSGSANFAYAYVERMSAWTTKLADATLQGFTV